MQKLEKRGMTHTDVKEWFDYKDGNLYWKKSPAKQVKEGSQAGSMNAYGYVRVTFRKKEYMLHRLIWLWHKKELIEGMQIDHINQCKTDNRIENLRQVSPSENKLNNKAKYVSYSTKSKKWVAYGPAIKRVYHYIGMFQTKQEAEEAVKIYCSS